jgi:hypothetical protein
MLRAPFVCCASVTRLKLGLFLDDGGTQRKGGNMMMQGGSVFSIVLEMLQLGGPFHVHATCFWTG